MAFRQYGKFSLQACWDPSGGELTERGAQEQEVGHVLAAARDYGLSRSSVVRLPVDPSVASCPSGDNSVYCGCGHSQVWRTT